MDQRLTPYLGDSADRLTELMNLSNPPGGLQHGRDFEFEDLQELAEDPTHNTTVFIKSLRPGRKSVTATYTRLELGVLNELPSGAVLPVVIPHFPITTHELLPNINSALGLSLSEDEVFNDTYQEDQEKFYLKIKSNESSLAWLISELEFIEATKGDLGELILVDNLDGLYPPSF